MAESDESFYIYENDVEYYDEDPSINHLIEHQSFISLCTNCALPILVKTLYSVAGFLILALIHRFSYDRIPNWCAHILSGICGIGVLYWNVTPNYYHVIFLGLSTYTILRILKYFKNELKGYLMAIYCFLYLLLCEFIVDDVIWGQLSGTQMIIVMKAVSVAFDIDKQLISMPSIVHYFGYIYSVSSILFGPWISFQEYLKVNVKMNWTTFKNISKYIFLSLFCLTISSCWGYWLIPDDYREPLLVYRDAFLFRNSHYFVCYLSKAISLTAGYDYTEIVQISSMELPKSLVQVVIHWNIPMHKWLKHYVFRPCQRLGKFAAILSVYIASSALHGFSAALALVLVSLGFYTYVEYMLRYKISQALNSCTLATPCKEISCTHQYKSNSILTIIINFVFSILAVIHLAYLGVIFEDISLMRTTNPFTHTISTWAQVGFLSHCIVFLQYFIYILI